MIKLKYYLSHLLLVWGSWHMNISSNLKNLIQIHILTLSKWVLLKSKFALKIKNWREKREHGKFEILAVLWWAILRSIWYYCLNTTICIFITLFNSYIFPQYLNNITKNFLIDLMELTSGSHPFFLKVFLLFRDST